jgi:UDP-glucose 4-epimerase
VRFLIVGGAGFIGSRLAHRLVSEGHSVDVVDDLSTGRLGALAEARRDGEVRVHTLDVRATELDQLIARRPVDVAVHLAAPAVSAGFVEHFTVAAGGLANLMASCRRHGVGRIVVALSPRVYGSVPLSQLPVTEAPSRVPSDLRGAVDAAMLDVLIGSSADGGPEYVAPVLATVYGPGATRGVVADLLRARSAGEPMALHGAGTQTRDFVFVDDVVDALARAGTRGSSLVVNVGTGVETPVAKVADLIGGPSVITPARAGDVTRMSLDVARAAVHLGWAPFTSLADGLAATLA